MIPSILRIASLASLTTIVIAGTSAASVHATPVQYAGRGIYHFASHSGCPFPDSGNADCNRVALDAPDVHASVDQNNRTIVFSSNVNHPAHDVLGDVLLQGSGIDANGQRVPLSAHVLLRRSGTKWNRDVYAHVPERSKFTQVRIDPYRIRVQEGKNQLDVFTPGEMRALFEHPSVASRLARYFVQVSATDPQHPSGEDLTIGLGVDRLSKSVARVRFTSSAPNGSDVSHALAGNTWAIQFDALSDHIPVWAARRELFLFGLDGSPLVKGILAHGLRKHDQLEFGMRNGKGYLRVNGKEQAFAGASASAHTFMQESFIGLILGWHRSSTVTASTSKAR